MNPVRAQALARAHSFQGIGLSRDEAEAVISWDGQSLWWGEKTPPNKVRTSVIDNASAEDVTSKMLAAAESAVENGWFITADAPDKRIQNGFFEVEDYLDPSPEEGSEMDVLSFVVSRREGGKASLAVPEVCTGTDLGAVIGYLSDHYESTDSQWQYSGSIVEGSANFFALMRIWRLNKDAVTIAYSKKADVYEFDRERFNSLDPESMALFGLVPKPLKVGEGKIKPVSFF